MATQDVYGLVGQVLDGQFRVDRVIGEGGFSVVYRGLHVGLDEPVAIKCLKLQTHLGSALVEAFIRRFRDESKIHYRLSRGSLHIARTIAAGTTMAPAIGALVPYMVLEWLEGYTLAEELRARRQRGESGRNVQEVIRLLDPVAEAMAFAHAQGVVHRDLNPSNIFVSYAHGTSKLKVLDFGVAKVISDHALSLGPRAATVGQIRMFTPAYAAPEQFHEALGPIGAQTDVYSFAVLIVELLADRAPIEGEHIGEFADRALDPERRPTPRAMGVAIGDAVEAVLARAVTVDPSQRPSDIGELWGMLKNAATRDAQINRAGGEPGFPKPPLAAAPSARAGYGMPAAIESDPPRDAGGTWTTEAEGSRYSFVSSRPEAPPAIELPREPRMDPVHAFAQTRKSAASDPTVPIPEMPMQVPQAPTLSKDTSPMGMPARKVTLVQGSLGAPTPTPGPYTSPVAAPAHAATAFAATVAQPIATPMPEPPAAARIPTPAPMPPGMQWHSPSPGDRVRTFSESIPPSVVKKSNVPLVVLVALALTVALVIVAIVANEMSR